LRSQLVCSYSRNSPRFMEPEGSSSHSQRPPPVPILSQPYPFHTSHFLMVHPNVIPPSPPGSPQRSLSLRFPQGNPVHTSPFPIRATCTAHLNLLDFITRTILGKEYRPFSSSLIQYTLLNKKNVMGCISTNATLFISRILGITTIGSEQLHVSATNIRHRQVEHRIYHATRC
jgi:hypothetical protein